MTRVAAAVALALVLAAITAGAAWTPPQPNPPPETGIQR